MSLRSVSAIATLLFASILNAADSELIDVRAPLSTEQKMIVKNTLSAVMRSMTAFNIATDSTGIMDDEGGQAKAKVMAGILKRDCTLTVKNPSSGDMNPKSIKRAEGAACPVGLNYQVLTDNSKEGLLNVKTDWKYNVGSSDYRRLNDAVLIDTHVSQITETERSITTTKIKRDGSLESGDYGKFGYAGTGSLKISDVGGKHDVQGLFRTQLQFKDFVFELREETGYANGKLVKLFYVNGVPSTEDEVDALIDDSPLF